MTFFKQTQEEFNAVSLARANWHREMSRTVKELCEMIFLLAVFQAAAFATGDIALGILTGVLQIALFFYIQAVANFVLIYFTSHVKFTRWSGWWWLTIVAAAAISAGLSKVTYISGQALLHTAFAKAS